MTPEARASASRFTEGSSFASHPGSLVAEKVSCPVVALKVGLAMSSNSETSVLLPRQDWQVPERTALGRPTAQGKSCTQSMKQLALHQQ